MSIGRFAALFFGLLLTGSLTPPVQAVEPPGADDAPEAVIVRVDDGVSPSGVAREVAGAGAHVDTVFDETTNGFAGHLSAAAIGQLRADPRVLAVEPDHPIQATRPQTGVRRIGADEYEHIGMGSGSTIDVDIAIVDTGIEATHPDLQVAGGVDCHTGVCTEVDDPTDPNGHGTHVAGIAAAHDDGAGVVGVAPGARLHSLRVLDAEGNGSLSSLLAGLEWLQDNAGTIEVANLSLGCDCRSTSLNDAVRAVKDAGVSLVVAAGNAGQDASGFSPANHPDAITVAAMSDYDGRPGGEGPSGCIADDDDSFASYSNHGAVVDLVAPGSCIISTWIGGAYARTSGTSMAAPHAAGAAAVHIASAGVPRSSTRPDEVRRALVEDLSVASTDGCGYTGSTSTAPMLHFTCTGASDNSDPTLDVIEPDEGLTVMSGTTVQLRATADDVEDGGLDDSIVWASSHRGQLGTGPAVDVQLSELGDHTIVAAVSDSGGATTNVARMVRVTDADGSTGDSVDEGPAIPEEPEADDPPASTAEPQLTIIAPVPSARIVADRELQLVALATDREDGDIRALVTWRSDRDGELGEGGVITARLSPGVHQIAATVTDSDDNRADRTATIEVAAAAELGSRGISGSCPADRVSDAGFSDVDANDLHADAIDCVAWWGIARGASERMYMPARTISRGQMASFLAEAIMRSGGHLPAAEDDHFDDDDGTTHETNINLLAAADVLRGTGGRTYQPDADVTRAQMASFLTATYEYRSSQPLPGIQERFTDVAGTHASSIDAIAAAGITGGVTPDEYQPEGRVRRDQMASFISRTLDVLVDTNVTAPPP